MLHDVCQEEGQVDMLRIMLTAYVRNYTVQLRSISTPHHPRLGNVDDEQVVGSVSKPRPLPLVYLASCGVGGWVLKDCSLKLSLSQHGHKYA